MFPFAGLYIGRKEKKRRKKANFILTFLFSFFAILVFAKQHAFLAHPQGGRRSFECLGPAVNKDPETTFNRLGFGTSTTPITC